MGLCMGSQGGALQPTGHPSKLAKACRRIHAGGWRERCGRVISHLELRLIALTVGCVSLYLIKSRCT